MTDSYYDKKVLSVSSVRQFAQNGARALDDWKGVYPFFENNDALLVGQYFHAGIQDFLTDSDKNVALLRNTTPELFAKTGKKGLLAKYVLAEHMVEILSQSDIAVWIYKALNNPDVFDGFVEQGLDGTVDNIAIKGKPDVFVADRKEKVVYAFDFKSSAKYNNDGYDWGEDINGKRAFSSVAWHNDKLFPWQAGVYRELLRQNGYADYKIVYRYIVMTKEKEPRLDVWTITDKAMDEGFKDFRVNLTLADAYIKGELEAPVVKDGSAWFNRRTQKTGNSLVADAETSD